MSLCQKCIFGIGIGSFRLFRHSYSNTRGITTARSLLNNLNERNSTVELSSRALLKLSGPDTTRFLQGLVTNDVNKLENEKGLYAAILTPQGRVIADLFLHQTSDGIILDCDRNLVSNLQQQLKRYILRSKVRVELLNGSPWHTWGPDLPMDLPDAFRDPRHATLGWRSLERVTVDVEQVNEDVYKLKRMLVGVPEGGLDIYPGQALPLECNMDYMNGGKFSSLLLTLKS
jgi:folate-binding Fe-S cluster repair protein YgfZ